MISSERQQRELSFEDELEFLEETGELVDSLDYSALRLLGSEVLGEHDHCPEIEEFKGYFERVQGFFKQADTTIEPDTLAYIISCWADDIGNPEYYKKLNMEQRKQYLAGYVKVFGLPDEAWISVIDGMWSWYIDTQEPLEFTIEAFGRINWVCELAGLPLIERGDPKVRMAMKCALRAMRREDKESQNPETRESYNNAMDYFVEFFGPDRTKLQDEDSE